MRCPGISSATPLQEATVALRDLLLDARAELDEDAYSWLVAVAVEIVGREAARLAVTEVLRFSSQAAA